MTESGDVDDEEEEKESEAPELSAEEKERMLGQIARDYAVPGRQSGK